MDVVWDWWTTDPPLCPLAVQPDKNPASPNAFATSSFATSSPALSSINIAGGDVGRADVTLYVFWGIYDACVVCSERPNWQPLHDPRFPERET